MITIPEFVGIIKSDFEEYLAEQAKIRAQKEKQERDAEIMRLKKIPGGLDDLPWQKEIVESWY